MHILGIFHVQIAQKRPKSHDPFPWQPGLKSHKSDTGFWLFALNHTSCANFIKIGDYRFPRPFGPYRELILRMPGWLILNNNTYSASTRLLRSLSFSSLMLSKLACISIDSLSASCARKMLWIKLTSSTVILQNHCHKKDVHVKQWSPGINKGVKENYILGTSLSSWPLTNCMNPKCMGVFLLLSSIYVRGMKSLGWKHV